MTGFRRVAGDVLLTNAVQRPWGQATCLGTTAPSWTAVPEPARSGRARLEFDPRRGVRSRRGQPNDVLRTRSRTDQQRSDLLKARQWLGAPGHLKPIQIAGAAVGPGPDIWRLDEDIWLAGIGRDRRGRTRRRRYGRWAWRRRVLAPGFDCRNRNANGCGDRQECE